MQADFCWCQRCCIRCQYYQMHSNCLCVKSVAFDCDTTRCTDEIVENFVSDDCIWCWCHQMHRQFFLLMMSKMMLHLMPMSLNALTILSVSEVMLTNCLIDNVRDDCIQCWCHQMHWQFWLMSKVILINLSIAKILQTNNKLSAKTPQTNDKFSVEIFRTNDKWFVKIPQTNSKLTVDLMTQIERDVKK